MATDARFDKIQKILKHNNANALEIAVVSGFPCVVKKGEFKEGQTVFYIRDDAKLVGWDELQERKARDREAAENGSFVTQDCFQCSFPWQTGLLKFLGGSGRVKTIKLRGEFSMGILLKTSDVCPSILKFDDQVMDYFNSQIADEANGAEWLEKNFGVKHWEMPVSGSLGDANAIGPLPFGLGKTDEENWQNIEDDIFPWGTEVLVTRKLDGTSCTIAAAPDGEVHVTSRSLDLVLGIDNVWNKAAESVVPLAKALAKHYGERIALRGEVVGAGINKNKSNIDCNGEPTFNMFAVMFPDAESYPKKIGLFGTGWHFLEVNKMCKQLTGSEIKTVPVEGTVVLTKELLEEITARPRSDGEGRVLNTTSVKLPHFKAKSKDYLANM